MCFSKQNAKNKEKNKTIIIFRQKNKNNRLTYTHTQIQTYGTINIEFNNQEQKYTH